MKFFAHALSSVALATSAAAAPACHPPTDLAPAPAYDPPPGEAVRGVTLAYYLLAITWTPEWRRMNGKTPAFTPELDPEPHPQGFALHGLWPNGAGPPYPRYCRPVGPIPAPVVRDMYCRTPSAKLLQHEWEAHGSCAWDDPAAYFRQAARLYDHVRLPRIEDRAGLSAGELRAAFVARNPWLRREAVFVAADKAGMLSEVRLCFDLAYKVAACPGGTGAPDGQALTLTPSTGRRF
ncbi:MAG TPA: ribonuclease T [Phenylobacterium sp.]|nr:ribonuclease T [Phenylobacterium sp.]